MGKIRVRRKGYWRRGYVRKDGVRVKRCYVPPATFLIRDRGKPGRGRRVIGRMEPGELRKHGYAINKSARARRLALGKAIREDGAATVWRRLHAQVILRKNARRGSAQARARARFEADRDWVAKKYGGPTPSAAIRAWRRMSPAERARRMPGRKRR
ncbi:MAG: hypothetical protein JRD89_01160 [Deltaproteobacteria bacterium]|nr:hypothetical protein [Deltaproteobacteria bacterium]